MRTRVQFGVRAWWWDVSWDLTDATSHSYPGRSPGEQSQQALSSPELSWVCGHRGAESGGVCQRGGCASSGISVGGELPVIIL